MNPFNTRRFRCSEGTGRSVSQPAVKLGFPWDGGPAPVHSPLGSTAASSVLAWDPPVLWEPIGAL